MQEFVIATPIPCRFMLHCGRIPDKVNGQNGWPLDRRQVVLKQRLRPLEQIERTILCTGSHGLTLDLLHDFLKESSPRDRETGDLILARKILSFISGRRYNITMAELLRGQ